MKIGKSIPVFSQGEAEYLCFRIPAIIIAANGHLIAFSEARKKGCSDTGDIDLVMKRSDNEGLTWSELQVIWNDNSNTCGNPVPILDKETGIIHLLSTWNLGIDKERQIIDQKSVDTRRVFALHSADNGKSWSEPKEITATTKLPNWTWYATGPGSGIQLQQASFKGRLMVACDHIEAGNKRYYSHVIYSDDHGKNWQLGGTSPKDQVNESEVAELPNGKLLLNMRNYDRNQNQRQIAISEDGGINWIGQKHDAQLIEPICQASLQVYDYQDKKALLFSNPANKDKRVNMSLRMSYDWGKNWTETLVLHAGPSAYSDLVVDNSGVIGCLFESGKENAYEQIVYSRVEWKN